MKEIHYKELSWPLRIATIGGWLMFIFFTINFVLGVGHGFGLF